jgi:hypothetical protein
MPSSESDAGRFYGREAIEPVQKLVRLYQGALPQKQPGEHTPRLAPRRSTAVFCRGGPN